MASSDLSLDSSSDSEATETEIEYDLKIKGSNHSSNQDDPYQTKPNDQSKLLITTAPRSQEKSWNDVTNQTQPRPILIVLSLGNVSNEGVLFADNENS